MLSMLKTWSSSKSIKALFIVATLWSCPWVQAQNSNEQPMIYQLQSDSQDWSPDLDGNLKLRLSASQAEVFVNYMLWDMIQKGLIRLYAPIGSYFDHAPIPGFDTVHLEHLMTHTSGYPEGSTIKELGALRHEDVSAPGEKFQPCPLNRQLIQKIFTVRGGRSQQQWFKEQMESLGLLETKMLLSGQIETTVHDLALWMNAWLDKGLLPEDLLKYFWQAQVQWQGRLFSYGWELLGDKQLLSWNEGDALALALDLNAQEAILMRNVQNHSVEEVQALVRNHFDGPLVRVWHLVFLLPLLLLILLRKKNGAQGSV